MRPLLPILLAVAVASAAGCGPAPSGLSPDDAYDAAYEAAADGDARRALALLGEAADAGHLDALAERAGAYEQGYLNVGYGPTVNLALVVWPGQAARARADLDHALAAGLAAGDDATIFHLAKGLAGDAQYAEITGDTARATAARDSAVVLYRRLGPDAKPLGRVLLAEQLALPDARRVLDAAAETDGPSCHYRALADGMFSTDAPGEELTALFLSVAYNAAYIDEAERCDTLDPTSPDAHRAAAGVRFMADNARRDARYRTLLDGLRADGVFERHPRLAAALADA